MQIHKGARASQSSMAITGISNITTSCLVSKALSESIVCQHEEQAVPGLQCLEWYLDSEDCEDRLVTKWAEGSITKEQRDQLDRRLV